MVVTDDQLKSILLKTKLLDENDLLDLAEFAKNSKATFTDALLEKDILTPEEIYAKINKVSANDVLRAARDIFKPEKLNLAIVGPFKNKESFQKVLKL